jgi:hypothetical protein
MVETEVRELRRQQTPPLATRNCGPVVAQQVGRRVSPRLRQKQECAGGQKAQAVAAVAVEGARPITGIKTLAHGLFWRHFARVTILRLFLRIAGEIRI